ncbi:BrnA antitoxin family protein [Elstera cyanobacteriorum]|uniref:BrnA antitoxin family protein n=1 Tax=Elstera cyanobacteriorum TaxID=2022747 RepID=UPI0023564A89|nr:BrnA antitoxin family protein [Elstera cyanobacteriorum]MCK6443206.1 BrnA antitoxin family protein [Elstera cyanobacteriorum]
MPKESIVRRSWSDLVNRQLSDERRVQHTALEAMSDEEAERRVAEDPDAMPFDEDFWASAEIVRPKVPVSIRLDPEVIAYFKAAGPGYQSRINAVLAHYVQAKRRETSSS